jgi:1-acyl-sn-glycerol-3-phosphate acyltransferase
LLRWFTAYVRWYLQRNFHGLHLLRLANLDSLSGWPLLVCLNHPAWWDPLLGLYVSQRFLDERTHYAAMAADGVAKYGFFRKIGFFGVSAGAAGAASFLRLADAALSRSDTALWITPQGEFADVRSPLSFAAGVGHLAARGDRTAMLPIALEYAFWTERYPEAFVALGAPVFVESGKSQKADYWTETFRDALATTQQQLAVRVMRRDPAAFEPLLEGRAGVGGVYDVWRAWKARAAGKKFQAGHGRF